MRHLLTNPFSKASKFLVTPLLISSLFAGLAHGEEHDPHGRRAEDLTEIRNRIREAQIHQKVIYKGTQEPF